MVFFLVLGCGETKAWLTEGGIQLKIAGINPGKLYFYLNGNPCKLVEDDLDVNSTQNIASLWDMKFELKL